MSIESIAKAGWHLIRPNCTRMNGQKKKVNVRQQLLPRLSALHVGDAGTHAMEAERQSHGGALGSRQRTRSHGFDSELASTLLSTDVAHGRGTSSGVEAPLSRSTTRLQVSPKLSGRVNTCAENCRVPVYLQLVVVIPLPHTHSQSSPNPHITTSHANVRASHSSCIITQSGGISSYIVRVISVRQPRWVRPHLPPPRWLAAPANGSTLRWSGQRMTRRPSADLISAPLSSASHLHPSLGGAAGTLRAAHGREDQAGVGAISVGRVPVARPCGLRRDKHHALRPVQARGGE